MLLVQASKDILQPGQAYKMGFFEEIVNGLRFILRLIWWTLRVYLFGHEWYFIWVIRVITRSVIAWSVIWVIQLIWTLKKLFVSYFSITWVMTHLTQGNNRILAIIRITWITHFLFISCLDQFCLYFPKSNVNGITRKHKWQKFEIYIRNQTYKRLVWIAAPISYSMSWSVGSPKFICLCINLSHYLNQGISDPFFQTNST